MIKRLIHNILFVAISLTAISCNDVLENTSDDESASMTGEAIVFSTQLSATNATSRTTYSVDDNLLESYKAVSQAYSFNITMQKEGETSTATPKVYSVAPDATMGELVSSTPLYWQDNVSKYGFKATAGTETLEADQTDKNKWIAQDRLHGYGYEPLLDEDNSPIDCINDYNYHTNKEWYTLNKKWKDSKGLASSNDEYKRVPLFLQHDRALVTIILKAGDGVKREDVLAATAATKLETKIYSYDEDGTSLTINPLAGKETVNYDKDVNGEATSMEVARYDAIVIPHNYLDKAEDEKICSVNLANQHFSFYAGNDSRYTDYMNLSEDEKLTSEIYQAYNLKAGDNLVITVTLSRESRKILMTAYVQPWTNVVTSYVCDDFGNSGDPIIINNQQELSDFLSDEKTNAPGNVAILNTDKIVLNDWSDEHDLNAILNLGNHTLTTDSKLFRNISTSGSLINGTLNVQKNENDVSTIICTTNEGTINHLTLTNADAENHAVVTRAAVAVQNYGYITNVTSYIKVEGKSENSSETTFIGGIAAISENKDGSLLPAVNNCYVDARVGIASGQTNVKGGGIVGAANGYVTGNTFEYGITLQQELTSDLPLRNIIHTKRESHDLYATGNQWPTETTNTPTGFTAIENNRATEKLYYKVIDCWEELDKLVAVNSSYNEKGKSYRLSDSFTVLSDNWELGTKTDGQTNATRGNVLFTLDGNNKIITLDGTKTIDYKESSSGETTKTFTTAPMLFANILGTVKDLQVNCKESLYGVPVYGETGESGDNMSSDICAPLAYSVIGGTVENVVVHAVQKSDGTYPQIVAAIPAGMIVWACDGAIIKNCTSDINVQMKVAQKFDSKDQRLYAGGIISEVAKATVTQCLYVPRNDYSFSCNKSSSMFCFGGIIGGTVQKRYDSGPDENPAVTITDCSSWYSFDSKKTSYTEGSVIGRSFYTSSEHNESGVNKDCQGNWWPDGVLGVGEGIGSNSDEKTIGKRNSVVPDKPEISD